MAARLVFLGRLEDLAGQAEIAMAVGPNRGDADWHRVLQWLRDTCSPELADAVAGEKVRVALNGALVTDKQALVVAEGDELALLPPVSGG